MPIRWNIFLVLEVFQAASNQLRIELRLGHRSFVFLNFPKPSLKSARFRDCLPHLILPQNLHKLKTRKSTAQHLQIGRCGVTESAGLANPGKELFHVPSHYLEPENAIGGGRSGNNTANISGEVCLRINSMVMGGASFILRQKILSETPGPTDLHQPVGQQITAGAGNRAQHVTAPPMRQKADKTSHSLT